MYVSRILTTPPKTFKTPLQQKTYGALEALSIPFERVETDEVITMEDCAKVDEVLQMEMVKTLFLCNRQKTAFYLYVTKGDARFRSADFSHALGISRVSFAPEDLMEPMLGTKLGATTVFSCLLDPQQRIHFVIDEAVLKQEWYGCSDGTTTCYLKLPTSAITEKLLPWAGHAFTVLSV